MDSLERFLELARKEVPIQIRYKDESRLMKRLYLLLRHINPDFMTRFTSTIGYTVYFPSKAYVAANPESALRVLAHETVHVLDAQYYSKILFSTAYLSPQIFSLGILSFPLLGFWALLFLIFALPLPSPGRFYLETRGYVMNWVTHPSENASSELYLKYFLGWDYYKMYPNRKAVLKKLAYWKDKIHQRTDQRLLKVWDWYQHVTEER